MTTFEQALALDKVLQEQGALEQALQIAQARFNLSRYHKYELATWTSKLAQGMADRETALEARVAAILASLTFHDYLKAQELAGEERWATLRLDLLASLSQSTRIIAIAA